MAKNKYVDDKFDSLDRDIDKIRVRHRQYISYSNEAGAKSVVDEIISNALDECRNPRSPGNKISIVFDEENDTITVEDNGRGIPTDILEQIFTTLNMGSNIYTSEKASLKAETLGQNGVGTLVMNALGENLVVESRRGGTENKYMVLEFHEGDKVHEETGPCADSRHGLKITYKPSKVLGKKTRIVWKDIHEELENLQYLNQDKISIKSEYINKKGELVTEKYKNLPFVDILSRNDKDKAMSPAIAISIRDDDINEELDGESVKRYLNMDVVFQWFDDLSPYIDSFSNSNNTVDGGDHIDGAMEALCRYFQRVTKASMSDREKEKLDIKWDDVKQGLSLAVALRTNFERMYTGQTKHKVVNDEIKSIIVSLLTSALEKYFADNQQQLKDIIGVIKMNAKARREGDKVKTAVVKNQLNPWSMFNVKNYDPCTAKGTKEYKELFIIEGDSAKGSLKKARDPRYQALFAIRGVSLNAFSATLDQIVGPKGNKEFTDLITVLGCNVGPKFDMDKLQFNKIIIASDADVDGVEKSPVLS